MVSLIDKLKVKKDVTPQQSFIDKWKDCLKQFLHYLIMFIIVFTVGSNFLFVQETKGNECSLPTNVNAAPYNPGPTCSLPINSKTASPLEVALNELYPMNYGFPYDFAGPPPIVEKVAGGAKQTSLFQCVLDLNIDCATWKIIDWMSGTFRYGWIWPRGILKWILGRSKLITKPGDNWNSMITGIILFFGGFYIISHIFFVVPFIGGFSTLLAAITNNFEVFLALIFPAGILFVPTILEFLYIIFASLLNAMLQWGLFAFIFVLYPLCVAPGRKLWGEFFKSYAHGIALITSLLFIFSTYTHVGSMEAFVEIVLLLIMGLGVKSQDWLKKRKATN